MEARVDARGSDHVIEKRKALQDIYDFLGVINQDAELSQKIDKEAVLRRAMRHLPFEDPEEFLKGKEEAPANPLVEMGGQSAANAVNQQIQADGGNQLINMLKDTYGKPATAVEPTNPNVASASINPSLGDGINLPQ
jgi:hypothetical protein